MKRNYHHPIFVQYKKSHINLFHIYIIKTNSIRTNKLNGEKLKLEISSIETN
jgi:hypothetical protein